MPHFRHTKFAVLGILAAALALVTVANSDSPDPTGSPSAPPVAAIRVVTDEYFGVKVADPYRYMEDLKNPEVAAWFKGQNEYTRAVLSRIPGRNPFLARIKSLDESAPSRITDLRRLPGGRYFYQKRLASEDVAKLYVRDGLASAERLLVDPTKFVTDPRSHFVISYYAPSFDGKYVAAGISAAGSEDAVLRIFDAGTGKETGDAIDRAQFGSPAWMPDGRSLLYNRLQQLSATSAPTDRYLNSRTYLHVLGTQPNQDRLIFGVGSPNVNIDPADIPFVAVWPGASYALGVIAHGVRNEITAYVAPLDALKGAAIPWKRICDVDDDVTGFDVHDADLYLLSHHGASASRFCTPSSRTRTSLTRNSSFLPAKQSFKTSPLPAMLSTSRNWMAALDDWRNCRTPVAKPSGFPCRSRAAWGLRQPIRGFPAHWWN